MYIGRTTFRNAGVRFGIARDDRFSHMYVIGKTGTGKSTLLQSMAIQDLNSGKGFALFDPHGDLVDGLLASIGKKRETDVIYLDVADQAQRWTFNPFAGVEPRDRSRAAAGIVEVFKKIWPDDWGPRLEHLLRNVAWTLLETREASFADVPRLLTDRDYRRPIVSNLENEEVRSYWRDEFERYSPAFRAVVTAPLQNKVAAILTDPLLKSILGARESTLDLADILERGKVLLVNLSRGRIGESATSILGSLLVSSLGLLAFRRASLPAEKRNDFLVYLDEFQVFATHSLVSMLSELRKYRVGLILAHQYVSQVDRRIQDAILGNIGVAVVFRVGSGDAVVLAREIGSEVGHQDLSQQDNYAFFAKMLVKGTWSRGFTAQTVPIDDQVVRTSGVRGGKRCGISPPGMSLRRQPLIEGGSLIPDTKLGRGSHRDASAEDS